MAKKPAVQPDNDAQVGHNSELTEGERKALFFHHLRKRVVHNARIKEHGDAKKADGKLAQADGMVLGDIDFAIKTITADDKKTVTDRFVAEGEILTWLDLSTGFQSDMFRDRAPAMERIAKEGERAGYAASEWESGYGPGSDEDNTWLNAYDAAQKQMQVYLEAAMLKRNAADELIKGASDEEPFPDEDLEAAE